MTLPLLESLSNEVAEGRVVEAIRGRIKDGTLRPGEAMPSERRLSEQFRVGRTVLRRALAVLDGEGVLQRSGPRLRTVAFDSDAADRSASDRTSSQPAWIKQSVVILTPARLVGGPSDARSRWLQYTTLGTIDHLRERNIHAITLSLGAIGTPELESLAQSNPLGVLIPEVSGGENDVVPFASLFRDAGVPVVCYGGTPSLDKFDRVVSDHESGAYELSRAVIKRGCKSIVRFWPRPWETYWFEARNRSHSRAVAEAGLELHPIAEFPYTPAPIFDRERFDYVTRQVAGFLLEPLRLYKPDALLMATDRDVPYAAAALRLHGITPGKDILLAGYDNYWKYCEETAFEPTAPTFSVDKCNQRAGSEMVQLLFDRIESRLPAERQTRVLQQNLIEFTSASTFDGQVV